MPVSVLVVDDSMIVRAVTVAALRSVFGERELTISEAEDGEEALAIAKDGGIDLILLDLTMPKVTGYQVLERLREIGSKAAVIVLSADIQAGAVERVMTLGAASFLSKPVLPGELTKALTELKLL